MLAKRPNSCRPSDENWSDWSASCTETSHHSLDRVHSSGDDWPEEEVLNPGEAAPNQDAAIWWKLKAVFATDRVEKRRSLQQPASLNASAVSRTEHHGSDEHRLHQRRPTRRSRGRPAASPANW